MKISELIKSLNEGKTVQYYADEFGVNRRTFTDKLKKFGYVYNNVSKSFVYVDEDGRLKDDVDNQEFIIEKKSNNPIKSKNNNIKKSEKNQIKEIEKSEESLTQDEIKFLKDLLKKASSVSMAVDFSLLPPKGKDNTKKHTLEISQETWDEFSEFADAWKEKRLSKNDLIEIAIMRLIRQM